MITAQRIGITGAYVGLRGPQSLVVIRRKVDRRLDRYDAHKRRDQIDAVKLVLQTLAKEIPVFTQKLLAVDERRCQPYGHRRNRYVAAEREQLYRPSRKDLAQQRSIKVEDFWLATCLGPTQKRELISEAYEAAGVERLSSTTEW